MSTKAKPTDRNRKRWVGQPLKRKEDARLLRGKGQYLADLQLPRTLHACFVRSRHAHARLGRIDLSAALEVPGVVAGFTGTDLLRKGMRKLLIPELVPALPGQLRVPPYTPLATDKVVFHGEPIAILLAEDRYALEDAAERVRVDYEPLPATLNPEASLEAEAPRLYEEWPDNYLYRGRMGNGVGDAFEKADIILKERFEVPRTGASPMEVRGAIAEWSAHGGLTLWTTTQRPHLLRLAIAQVLEWPEHLVRVIAPRDQGGSFGTKAPLSREDFVLALVAREVGRPVRWVETREESFRSGVGQERAQIHYMELAATKDGRILGFRDRCVADVGTGQQPVFMGIGFPRAGCFLMSSFYDIPQIEIELVGAVTNKPCLTPSRAFGSFPSRFVMDRIVNRLATELGLDPVEVMRKNLVKSFPYNTATGNYYDCGDYLGGFEKLLRLLDIESLRREQQESRKRGRFLGIGFGGEVERSGVSSQSYVPRQRKPGYGVATVKVLNTGKVQVFVGDPPSGQSHETVMAQVVADEFGVTPDDVRLDYGDTLTTPFGIGNVGNRMSSYTVSAAVKASRVLRTKLATVAAHDLMLKAAPEDFLFENGNILWAEDPDVGIPLAHVAKHLIELPLNLPPGVELGLEHTAYYEPTDVSNMVGSSFHGAVVEVNPESGEFKILRYLVVDDCGQPINPLVVEGQVQGGVVLGIGNAIFEQFIYNQAGELQNPTLEGYLMPSAADVPHIECHDHSVPTPHNPLGTKGKGEGAPAPVPGTLANAIEDALAPFGVKLTDIPLRPERIRRAIADALHVTDVGEEATTAAPTRPPLEGEGEAYQMLNEMYRLHDGIRISLQPIWHPYIGAIRTWRRDYEQALDRVAGTPAAIRVLEAMLSGEHDYSFNLEASALLTAEWQRLEELPHPDSQHAYLEFILPAFEAHAMLLTVLSHTPTSH
mgnify:CR=1 FL=1